MPKPHNWSEAPWGFPLPQITRFLAISLAFFACVGAALAQAPDAPPTVGPSGATPTDSGTGGVVGGAPQGSGLGGTPSGAISSNPGAVNISTGTGKLGQLLGLEKDSGVHFGGLWIGDASGVLAGGVQPGQWGLNSLTILDTTLDTEKLGGWAGGLFGAEFLQFSGQPTNNLAGSQQGFDSLPAGPPLVRQELYQLWWRQEFGEKFIVRAGKMVPTYDFNNVSKPVPVSDEAAQIPSVTSVGFTPIFVNPTMLGVLPGYYNSACGVTLTYLPTKQIYVNYGAYDGSGAIGDQTGLMGPQFNGHYFHIAETGVAYRLGSEQKPGRAAIGIWRQTGPLTAANTGTVQGAGGVYAFGSQRLWYRNPGVDHSGVSFYYQLGANNSNALEFRQYFGTGLTAFGLVPGRKDDSFGFGLAWAFLNGDPNAGTFFSPGLPGTKLRTNEMMMQWYYQMALRPGAYFQPAMTYIPNPGARPGVPGAFAVTLRLTLLF